MFDQSELSAQYPPDPTRQLPDALVGHLAAIIMSEFPVLHVPLQEELRTAMETRTARDWTRVANAMRHYYGRPGLAQEIEDALNAD